MNKIGWMDVGGRFLQIGGECRQHGRASCKPLVHRSRRLMRCRRLALPAAAEAAARSFEEALQASFTPDTFALSLCSGVARIGAHVNGLCVLRDGAAYKGATHDASSVKQTTTTGYLGVFWVELLVHLSSFYMIFRTNKRCGLPK